ncbi:MAG: hypothetical protein ACRC2R_26390 [Xenococcaceae cyanobacterium]
MTNSFQKNRISNFDVVVVSFPFTDATATKKRPALIISDAVTFNRIRTEMLKSNDRPTKNFLKVNAHLYSE